MQVILGPTLEIGDRVKGEETYTRYVGWCQTDRRAQYWLCLLSELMTSRTVLEWNRRLRKINGQAKRHCVSLEWYLVTTLRVSGF